MSSYQLSLPATPVHVSFSSSTDSVAILYGSGAVQVWELNTRIPDAKSGSKLRGGGKVAEPKLAWEGKVAQEGLWTAKQLSLGESGDVGVLLWAQGANEAECRLDVIVQGGDGGSSVLGVNTDRVLAGRDGRWLVLADTGDAIYGEFMAWKARS
jgi:elongator complex protein 1